MKIKIGKSAAIPQEFNGLGNIILKSETMRKLGVIPGDYVLISKQYEGQDVGIENIFRIFKVSVPFDTGLDFKDCSGLIEESGVIGYFGEFGEFKTEKINNLENFDLKEVFIENSTAEEIEKRELIDIKNYLLERKIPVNPLNIFIFNNNSFFFSQLNKSGLINHYSDVFCFRSWLISRIKEIKELIEKKKLEEKKELEKINSVESSTDLALNREDEEITKRKEKLSATEQNIIIKQSEVKDLDKKIYDLKLKKLELKSILPSSIIEEI